MRYTDRSRIERDWRCPRARYWMTEYAQTGIVPARIGFDLEFGTAVHDGIELGVVQGDAAGQLRARDEVIKLVRASGGQDDDAGSWGAIAEGLVAGFLRAVWPRLEADYTVVGIEQEMNLQLTDDLLFQARPDLLLEHRRTGELWYYELKTTGNIEAQWLQSWQKAPQVQLGALATEQTLGRSVAGCVVVGLYKGRKYDGRSTSPFAWGWRTEEIGHTHYSYEPQRKKGWERFPVWSGYPAGVSAWVQGMPMEILDKQFATSEAIYLRRDLTDALIKQIVAREDEIAYYVHTDSFEATFPQHFNTCSPAYGFSCEYQEACWVPWVGRDPLASGLFVRRTPHHEAERKFFELKQVS